LNYGITSKCNLTAASGGIVYTSSPTAYQAVGTTSLDIQAAVYQQPVSVAVEADQPVFQQYTGGIITSSSCGTTLDHAILAVGYGSQNGQDYWIVQNSWSNTWG